MKKIPISKNEYAFVDDEDFELVTQFKWSSLNSHKSRTTYATTR